MALDTRPARTAAEAMLTVSRVSELCRLELRVLKLPAILLALHSVPFCHTYHSRAREHVPAEPNAITVFYVGPTVLQTLIGLLIHIVLVTLSGCAW